MECRNNQFLDPRLSYCSDYSSSTLVIKSCSTEVHRKVEKDFLSKVLLGSLEMPLGSGLPVNERKEFSAFVGLECECYPVRILHSVHRLVRSLTAMYE